MTECCCRTSELADIANPDNLRYHRGRFQFFWGISPGPSVAIFFYLPSIPSGLCCAAYDFGMRCRANYGAAQAISSTTW